MNYKTALTYSNETSGYAYQYLFYILRVMTKQYFYTIRAIRFSFYITKVVLEKWHNIWISIKFLFLRLSFVEIGYKPLFSCQKRFKRYILFRHYRAIGFLMRYSSCHVHCSSYIIYIKLGCTTFKYISCYQYLLSCYFNGYLL